MSNGNLNSKKTKTKMEVKSRPLNLTSSATASKKVVAVVAVARPQLSVFPLALQPLGAVSARRFGSPRRSAGAGKKTELTEEQLEEIKEAFNLFDTDHSGERKGDVWRREREETEERGEERDH